MAIKPLGVKSVAQLTFFAHRQRLPQLPQSMAEQLARSAPALPGPHASQVDAIEKNGPAATRCDKKLSSFRSASAPTTVPDV
ncbi:hypothetical protein B9Z51_17115 [Limnohabitans sp. T6-5]|nr:hypothetical protein B9Z51_17115 [Limnohabitans sp. T6-5]